MKHVGNFFGIIFCTGIFFVFVFFELQFLDSNPPSSDVSIEKWKANFQLWAFICVLAATAASILWYILAQWVFKINRWEDTEKRSVWLLLFLLPGAAIIVSIILVGWTKNGLRLDLCLFFALNMFSYYFSTVLFSPSSFKFTPMGAKSLRRW